MKEFLTKVLGVPEGRIQCLLSPNPTPCPDPERKNIIDTLLNLSTNPEIQHGDNIIIYFSGHGSSYELSDFYEAGDIAAEGSIEALCPVDRTASGTESSIPDISDREINIILAEIAHAKGNHITLILDCCYSSGASRDPSESPNVVRHATSLPATSIKDMLEAADTRLGKLSRYHSVFERNWKPDMTSHVVLAACAETQYAEEAPEGGDNRWNGVFTQALVKALKSNGLKEDSTYVDLIRASKMPQNTVQRPVIAGNSSARLWYQPKV